MQKSIVNLQNTLQTTDQAQRSGAAWDVHIFGELPPLLVAIITTWSARESPIPAPSRCMTWHLLDPNQSTESCFAPQPQGHQNLHQMIKLLPHVPQSRPFKIYAPSVPKLNRNQRAWIATILCVLQGWMYWLFHGFSVLPHWLRRATADPKPQRARVVSDEEPLRE